jgi:hypothetical protein
MSDQQQMNRGLFILLLLCSVAACRHHQLPGNRNQAGPRAQFRRDYHCAASTATKQGNGEVRVEGCGKIAVYYCVKGQYSFGRGGAMAAVPGRCTLEYIQYAEERSVAKPVERVMKDGVVVWRAQLNLDTVELRLYGAPIAQPDDVMVLFTPRRHVDDVSQCVLDLIVDGERMAAPAGELKQGKRVEYSFHAPFAWVERLGSATRVVGKLCGQPFTVWQEAQKSLHNYVIRYREERTLAEAATPSQQPQP